MDPKVAKEMAETRKKMQGMGNMDLVGSSVLPFDCYDAKLTVDRLSSMLAGGQAPPAATNSGASTPAKSTGQGAGKRRKGR